MRLGISDKADFRPQCFRTDPAGADRGQGLGRVPLGVAFAVRSHQQAVVAVGRRGQAEQRLQQPLDMGGLEQVLAAHDVCDLLDRVIDHHGQVIGDAQVLARQDDIADQRGPCGLAAGLSGRAAAQFGEVQRLERRPERGAGGAERQPTGERLARRDAARLLGLRQGRAEIGGLRPVRRAADVVQNLAAGLEAAIDQAPSLQTLQRGGVVVQVL